MSLNLGKLPENSVIPLIHDADISFDSVDPTHCRVKHVTIVNKLLPNDGLNLLRTRRKICKLSPYSLYSLLDSLNADSTIIPSLAIDPASEILNPPVILLNCCAPILRVIRVPRPIGNDGSPVAPRFGRENREGRTISESPEFVLKIANGLRSPLRMPVMLTLEYTDSSG